MTAKTRVERKREETRKINAIRGYKEIEYDIDEEEDKKVSKKVEKDFEDIDYEEGSKLKKIIMYITLLIALIVVYSIYIEPKLLFTIHEYGIETNKIDDKMDGLKIVHFSDIHYGTTINKDELDRVIKKINKIKPDIILFTGDLFDKNIILHKDSIKDIKKLFNKLNSTSYKYAIYGDNDYNNKDEYIDIMESAKFTILDNNYKLIYMDSNNPIEIIGINKYENKDYSFIDSPIEGIDTSNIYKIIIDHEVDNIDNYKNSNIDLILNAHSMGGIINIPLLGRIINEKGAKKYKDNIFDINNTKVYNSNGIGTSSLKARFNNIPSINFYRIYKS